MTDATLSAKVTADIADFTKKFDGLKNSVDKIAKTPDRVSDAFESMGTVGAKALQVLGGAVASFSLGVVANQILDVTRAAASQAEQVERLSVITGTSTDTMQEWGIALNRARLGPEDLTLAMRTLNLHVKAAQNPASESALAFEQMGIKLSQVGSTESLIRLLADRFSQMQDPVERSVLATQLLGRAGQQLIPFMVGGSRAIDDASEAARRMGAVFSSSQLKSLSELDDKFDDLSKATDAFKTTIALAFAPAATTIVERMTVATGATNRFFQALISGDEKIGGISGRLKALAETFVTFGATGGTKDVERMGNEIRILTDAAKDLTAIDLDSLSQKFIALNSAEAQEGLGFKIRDAAIGAERLKVSLGHAQEQLGKFALDKLIHQFKESQHLMADLFDIDVIERQEKAIAAAFAPPDMKGWSEMQRAVAALRDLMPELDGNEAFLLATHNIQAGTAAVQEQVDAWQRYRDGLSDAVDSTRALETHQAALFQVERGFLGAADAARRVSFARIQAEEDQKRQAILDTFGVTERSQQKLLDLEEQSMAQRLAVVRQYPTFWETQLQALVDSNSFSVGSIVSTWSSGLATAVVQNKNFGDMVKAAWQSTQIAVLQAGINTLVQWGAQLALSAARELGLATATQAAKDSLSEVGYAAQLGSHAAFEEAKTALSATNDAARLVATVATAKLMDAVMIASLASMSAMATAALAIAFAVSQVVAGIAYGAAAIMAVTPFGQPAAAALIVATTGFEIATGAAIVAAGGVIQAALGAAIVASSVPAFATGGAVFGPTLALVGENASRSNPEYIGHANQLGLNRGSGPVTLVLNVDGRTLAKVVAQHLGPQARLQGAFS